MPGELLTITGPAAPAGETVMVSYLLDGEDYIVLAAEAETRLPATLRTATAATLTDQQIPVGITTLTADTERAALLSRLLKQASLYERHEVRQHCQVPIARLTPHCRSAPCSSVVFAGLG
jgi:hypothetical protein